MGNKDNKEKARDKELSIMRKEKDLEIGLIRER
jgi:hypothetical protein